MKLELNSHHSHSFVSSEDNNRIYSERKKRKLIHSAKEIKNLIEVLVNLNYLFLGMESWLEISTIIVSFLVILSL